MKTLSAAATAAAARRWADLVPLVTWTPYRDRFTTSTSGPDSITVRVSDLSRLTLGGQTWLPHVVSMGSLQESLGLLTPTATPATWDVTLDGHAKTLQGVRVVDLIRHGLNQSTGRYDPGLGDLTLSVAFAGTTSTADVIPLARLYVDEIHATEDRVTLRAVGRDRVVEFTAESGIPTPAATFGSLIFRWSAGAGIDIVFGSALVWKSGDVLSASVSGTTLRAFQNGTEILSATDANVASGSTGLYLYSDVVAACGIADWRGTDATQTILDTFDRPGPSLGAAWTQANPSPPDPPVPIIDSNQVIAGAASSLNDTPLYTGTAWANDQSASVTLGTWSPPLLDSGQRMEVGVALRLTHTPSAYTAGYGVIIFPT